ncbi:hypothetical protein BMF35_a1571 [Aurantiacibacter gangjinensis]|nr:hypothetical protein BMF35_a1571 [Aurantiacibacter gangjinensis]
MTMKKLISLLVLLSFGAACSSPEQDAESAPAAEEEAVVEPAITGPDESALDADDVASRFQLPAVDTPYNEARDALLAAGYGPSIGQCSGIGIQTCDDFPEIDNCSGTGAGFCDMTMQRPGECVAIVTSGGPPQIDGGTAVIASIELRQESCEREPLFPQDDA